MKHDLAARRAAVESSCRKSSAALADGDWHAAIDHLVPLGRGAIQDGAVRQLCGQISDRAVEEIDAAIQSGRLDVAASLLRNCGASARAQRRMPGAGKGDGRFPRRACGD